MSNILIIKHGSLGDISQISGVLRDIRETYYNSSSLIWIEPQIRNDYIPDSLCGRKDQRRGRKLEVIEFTTTM